MRKRPEGFPHEIYVDTFARVEKEVDVVKHINDWSKIFINQQCMIVPKDGIRWEDLQVLSFDTRILVPLHMITFISTETKRIVGEIPGIGEDGMTQLSDGTKVSIQ